MQSKRYRQIIQDGNMVYMGLFADRSSFPHSGCPCGNSPDSAWARFSFVLHPDDLHGLPKGKLPIGVW